MKNTSVALLALLIASTAFAQQRRPLIGGIDEKRDLPYAGTDNPRQRLDLFLPKKRTSDKLLPVIAFIHGGGWSKGDKAGGLGRVAPFVASGEYAGVSVGYRLSGEAQWPAQAHDCKAAIRWIHANAKQYGLDAGHVGVWGMSAGGHLVSLLGASGGVKELEGGLGPHTSASSSVACVVNYFGPQNFFTMLESGSGNAAQAITGLFGGTVEEKAGAAKAASTITHVTPDDPPFLTAHGTLDGIVPYGQALELDAALKKAGVPSLLIEMTGAGHGFQSADLDERVKQFFDLHLRGVKADISAKPVVPEPPRK